MNRIRIGATSDWHLTDGPRFEPVHDVLRWIAKDLSDQEVDLTLLIGDFYGRTVPYRSTNRERDAVEDLVIEMAERGPVVIVPGNHDYEGELRELGKLQATNTIHVVEQPEIVRVYDEVAVFVLPYPQKKFLIAATETDTNVLGAKQAYEEGLRAIFAEWKIRAADLRERGVFTIGAFHVNVAGSKIAGDEVLAGHEIEAVKHDLEELGLDAIFLGHVHRHQEVARRAWFCGTPAAQDHGEESYDCGYIVADVGEAVNLAFRRTPARRLTTVNARWAPNNAGQFQWDGIGFLDVAGVEVRLRVDVDEERAATCPVDELVQTLKDAGAFSVVVDRRIIPKVRVRSEAIQTAQTVAEKVSAYWDTIGREAPKAEQRERCLAKLSAIEGGAT